MILQHGTTLQRANSIMTHGPDIAYHEPGGLGTADGFSCNILGGPQPLDTVVRYAQGKSQTFSNEGGPAILEIDVPAEIVDLADSPWLPVNHGVVQFDEQYGLEELLKVWDTIPKRIIELRST